MERNNSRIGSCIYITNTISVNLDVSDTIISCTNGHYVYAQGNKIRIQKEGKGHLKIFEVTIMGMDLTFVRKHSLFDFIFSYFLNVEKNVVFI